ncbi:hypothetical protein CR162_16715 [Pseudoroseomonas rhizosphaerae]|uniref:Glycosyl transferase family 1 domain-containing protein n=1 Tax=Teichococcus rhizosphaerae TaxID=1335062 RepID=A0A2C7A9N5_9PROT|nr:glycosyltransferase family 1 protein [Pseudoroseomonas rhizosphaerae]PHK93764.1 hypothetical protein CR162_16715 [Pseudoroseomonas rhizosphaerae]
MLDDAEALRREADGLRDRREWRAAAAAYAAFLRLRPEDAGMQVQQGHCLKEAGDIAGALALYHAAAGARPGDADIPLQIGHAEKLRGARGAALEAYGRAVLLDPRSESAWREWRALAGERPGRPPGRPLPAAAGVVLDLTDLANWIGGGRRAPSGIQRVQLDIARAALEEPSPPRLCAMPASPGGHGPGWRELPAPLFLRLDRLMSEGADPEEADWKDAATLLEALLAAPPPLRFAPGAVLVTLGGTWGMPDHLASLRVARERDGLRHVPLLHDCIPLLLPEHCAEGVTRAYARWFANLALHADGVLAVSRSTADDMRRLHGALLPGLPVPPAAVLRLDAAPRALTRPAPAPPPEHPLLRDGTPFVLFVSTIEARKNHLMAFGAWLALLRRLGPEAVPVLVCVGRPGWLAEAALALRDSLPELRSRIRILHDVPDPLLAALYRNCLFTLYNSHHEGWGLPVTESLAAGKVPLVPAHSALREAGEGGALFFAPGSEPDLLEKLARLITDPAFRAEAEARIAAAPPLRSWNAVAAQLMAEARALALAAPADLLARLPVPSGRRHRLRRIETGRPSPEMAIAEAVRRGEGWHALEAEEAWTRPGEALLAIPLGPDQAGPLRLELALRAPAGAPRAVEVLAQREGAEPAAPAALQLRAGESLSLALEVPAGGPLLRVELLSQVPPEDGETAHLGIGVAGFGVARAGRLEDRLGLLEERRFLAARPVM